MPSWQLRVTLRSLRRSSDGVSPGAARPARGEPPQVLESWLPARRTCSRRRLRDRSPRSRCPHGRDRRRAGRVTPQRRGMVEIAAGARAAHAAQRERAAAAGAREAVYPEHTLQQVAPAPGFPREPHPRVSRVPLRATLLGRVGGLGSGAGDHLSAPRGVRGENSPLTAPFAGASGRLAERPARRTRARPVRLPTRHEDAPAWTGSRC